VFLLVVRDYGRRWRLFSAAPAANDQRLTARVAGTSLCGLRTALVTCIGAGLNLLVVSTIWHGCRAT
jgi:hypothetical protein